MMRETVVIGIGNTIKRDDGIGVVAVRRLHGLVPEGVELVEGSVYCADLLGLLEGRRKAIFVDAIDAGEEPGAIFRFSPDEVRQRPSQSLSLHDFGLYELIAAARLLDQCPEEITVIAVQTKDTGTGEAISQELEAVLPRVCEIVLDELVGGTEQ